jgi:hypothetical protein
VGTRDHTALAIGLAILATLASSCARSSGGPSERSVRDAGCDTRVTAGEPTRAPATRTHEPFVPEGGGPIVFGPRERRFSSEACGACHEAEHRAWSRSAHARAHTDPLYVRELALRPSRACERCHAPLADATAATIEGAWADEGVGCAACHVREGVVVHAHVSGRAPHETRLDARVGQLEGCRACHQFPFPAPEHRGQLTHAPGEWLQDTVGEWVTSEEATAGLACIDCHLPEREGLHDHALPGHRDRSLLANALDVRVRLERGARAGALIVTLRSRAGHAVPTGDLYRSLEIRAWRDGGPARRELLGRVYARRGTELVEIEDDRVRPGETRRVTLRLPRAGHADGTIHYELRLWSLDPALVREERLPRREVVRRVTRGEITP